MAGHTPSRNTYTEQFRIRSTRHMRGRSARLLWWSLKAGHPCVHRSLGCHSAPSPHGHLRCPKHPVPGFLRKDADTRRYIRDLPCALPRAFCREAKQHDIMSSSSSQAHPPSARRLISICVLSLIIIVTRNRTRTCYPETGSQVSVDGASRGSRSHVILTVWREKLVDAEAPYQYTERSMGLSFCTAHVCTCMDPRTGPYFVRYPHQVV